MKRVILQIILGLALIGGTTAIAYYAQSSQAAELEAPAGQVAEQAPTE